MHLCTSFKEFSTSYTYWDYQQTWFNAFYLQNTNHSHSWLFYFHHSMTSTKLPIWFLRWWDYFGCHVDFLKDHPLVENGYLHFKNNFQPTPCERKFPPFSFFVENSLFHGCVHGSMITTSKIDIQSLSVNSKSNDWILLQLNQKVSN